MEQAYVVVTIYTPPNAQARNSKSPIVHTYGPYDISRAQWERQQMLKKAALEGYSQHLTVKISRIIDPEGKAQFSVVPNPVQAAAA